MNAVNIFVEGKSDKIFVSNFISNNFNIHLSDDQFIIIGGCTLELISNRKNFFVENIENEIKNILIFDVVRNTFSETKNNLLQWMSQLEIEFKLFLFPNRKDCGNLETVLENIALAEHKLIFDCSDNYQNCISKHYNHYTLPNQKAKIYAYLEANTSKHKSESINEEKRNYNNTELWNLKSEYLSPLKLFLSKHLFAE